MSSDNRITIEINNQIAVVSLDRPDKHNAIDMAMFNAIKKTIKALANNNEVRVVIVKGNGPSFCSGLDVKSVLKKPGNGIKLLWKWWPYHPNLAQCVTIGWRQLTVPVIMVLHGNCWGGGMQIALGGDYRIAAPDTSLSIMEAKLGLIPDMGGTPALKENVSLDKAMMAAMTADEYTAEQALSMNLISEVSAEPYETALKLAEKLKARSPNINKKIKRFYLKVWNNGQGKILAGETFNQLKILFVKIILKKQ